MLRNFWQNEDGFIVSAELVFIATILVIGMVVGLVEVQSAVVTELNDISCAIGSLVQTFTFSGFTKSDGGLNHMAHAQTFGSSFTDHIDFCDNCDCVLGCDTPGAETTH